MLIIWQFIKFSGISGVGWVIDVCIYLFMINILNMSPFYSNYLSSTIAVSFVYFASVCKIFNFKDGFNYWAFFIYLIYQFLSISGFSFIIDVLTRYSTVIIPAIQLNYHAITAKIVVTPFTLITNYIFMKLLIGNIIPILNKINNISRKGDKYE